METKYVYDLHAENFEWLKREGFYKDEIQIMQNRLTEVASRNTSQEIQVQVEHFQNQLIIQRDQLDHLHHNLKQQENLVEDNIRQNPTAANHRKMEDHSSLRDQVDTFDKIFQDLRQEMKEFLSRSL